VGVVGVEGGDGGGGVGGWGGLGGGGGGGGGGSGWGGGMGGVGVWGVGGGAVLFVFFWGGGVRVCRGVGGYLLFERNPPRHLLGPCIVKRHGAFFNVKHFGDLFVRNNLRSGITG